MFAIDPIESHVTHTRILKLEGGRNFRDLGGYATADGRRVKWQKVFRSGSMAGLTQAGWDSVMQHGIRAVCDLRTTHERDLEPFAWQDSPALQYFACDYASSFAELRKVMAQSLSGAAARDAMMHGYRELPFEQARAYKQIFTHLAAGEVPLIFNCSAGKDRAGTAAALVLAALGVDRDTVIQDFVLTNEAVDLHKELAPIMGRLMSRRSTSPRSPEVLTAILQADPDYIVTALDSIDARHGSIEAYLHEVLGIDAISLESIKRHLLE